MTAAEESWARALHEARVTSASPDVAGAWVC